MPDTIRYKLEMLVEPSDEDGLFTVTVFVDGAPGDLLGAQRVRLPEGTAAGVAQLREQMIAITAITAFGELAHLMAANGWLLERPRR